MDAELFAACAPGLEPIAEAELRALGMQGVVAEPGGVAFRGGAREIVRANRWLRSASRVLLRLGAFPARDFGQLRRRASRLTFERCLLPGRPLRLSVSSSRSRLVHGGAIAERVRLAIAERIGSELPEAKPGGGEDEEGAAQLVLVRLVRDRCVVSVDTSGALLHRRGWRRAAGKAPLRETLAAALLQAAGWDGGEPLADPFCGTGTIAIEAALLARGLAPGGARRFACLDWPDFDAAAPAEPAAAAGAAAPIVACDRDAGAIEAARANARAAGVEGDVALARCAVSAFEPPPGRGLVATNPPYGVRLRGAGDLRDLYARFGATLRRRCPGWRVALLCADRRLARATGLELAPHARWRNGGLPVELLLGRVPEGERARDPRT